MDTSIPKELIEHLVKIGRSENYGDLEVMENICPSARSGAFMRLRPESWYQVANTLSQEELVGLIKSITLLERYKNFKAGSVSPVIWLFRHLTRGETHTALANWILNNTENDYLPFGSSNHGAKSLDDYHRRCKNYAQQKIEHHQTEQKRQENVKVRKAGEASQRLFGALKRKDRRAVSALLNRGADPYSKDEQGKTAIEYAKSLGVEEWLDQKEP